MKDVAYKFKRNYLCLFLIFVFLFTAGCGGEDSSADPGIYDYDGGGGVPTSFWLHLDDQGEEVYAAEADEVHYRLTRYGKYITVYMTNSGSENKIIGGEYRLQRKIDGEYTDMDDDNDMITEEGHVRDMQLIYLKDEADGTEIKLANEDDCFTIAPGQKIMGRFLTLRYRIHQEPEYSGDYRFIYGDVAIDFKLFCDVVS